jgi:1,2-diacylglycerol 3-beta-galactosyltransferase
MENYLQKTGRVAVDKKKRILILTADAGFGHRSAANALAAAIELRYGEQAQVEIVNPLDDKRAPLLLRDSQSDYDKVVRKAPELYRLGYDASDTTVTSAILESAVTVMLFEVMRDLLREHRPHVIVSTYPLYLAPLEAVFSVFKVFVPLLTVITDLATVHRIWFHPGVDAVFASTEKVRDLAIDADISADKITVTGIPVHPLIAEEKRPPNEIRTELGWQTDLLTILAVGSKRVEGLMDILHVINHYGMPLQLAVVCGKDKEMFAELHKIAWHLPVHLYEYSSEMPTLMHAADLVICKAGGLIVTESLACGLPMILVDIIPGQEMGNMEYVVENGAGQMVETPIEALEALRHLTLKDGELLKAQAANARRLGKPLAAFTAAELIWQAAQRSPIQREHFKRKTLLDLLRENQIVWGEDESIT